MHPDFLHFLRNPKNIALLLFLNPIWKKSSLRANSKLLQILRVFPLDSNCRLEPKFHSTNRNRWVNLCNSLTHLFGCLASDSNAQNTIDRQIWVETRSLLPFSPSACFDKKLGSW